MGGPAIAVPPAEPVVREFYAYSVEFLTLAAGATQNENLQTESDSAFVVDRVAGAVGTSLTAFTAAPPFLVQIQDTGAGATWFDKPVHFLTLFRHGSNREFDFILPERAKRRLAPNTTQRIQVQNLDGVNAYYVRLTFYGWKER
jgi:hypothetical protein